MANDGGRRARVRLVNPYDVHEHRGTAGGRATAAAAVLAGAAGLAVLAAGSAAADTPEDGGGDPFGHLDAAPAGSGGGTGSSDLFADTLPVDDPGADLFAEAPPVDGSGADLFSTGSDAVFGVADQELPVLDPAPTPPPPPLPDPSAVAVPPPASPVDYLFPDPAAVTDPAVLAPAPPAPAVLPALGEPPTPPVPDLVEGAGDPVAAPAPPGGASSDGTTPTAGGTGSGAGGEEPPVQVEIPGDAGAPQDGSGPVPSAAGELPDAGPGLLPAPASGSTPPTSVAPAVTPDPSVAPAGPAAGAAAGTGADPQGSAGQAATDGWTVGETSPDTTSILDALGVPPGASAPAAGPPPDGPGPGTASPGQPGEPAPADPVFGVTTAEETAALDEALAPAMGSGAPSEAVRVWEDAFGTGVGPADPVFGVTTEEETASLDQALAPALGSGTPSEAVRVWEDALGTGVGPADPVFGVTAEAETAALDEALAPALGSGAPSEAVRVWEDALGTGVGPADPVFGVTAEAETAALDEALAPASGSGAPSEALQAWQDLLTPDTGAGPFTGDATTEEETAALDAVLEPARVSGATAATPDADRADGRTGASGGDPRPPGSAGAPRTEPAGRPSAVAPRTDGAGPTALPRSGATSGAVGEDGQPRRTDGRNNVGDTPADGTERSRLPGAAASPALEGPGQMAGPPAPGGSGTGPGEMAGPPAPGAWDLRDRERAGPPAPGAGSGATTADSEQGGGGRSWLPTGRDGAFAAFSAISTSLNSGFVIQKRSLEQGTPITFGRAVRRGLPSSLGPSVLRDLTLSSVNREPILENPFADIGAKAAIGTGVAYLSQEGARLVNPHVNRLFGTSGPDEIRLDSPHTMSTFGLMNLGVPVFRYAGRETLEALGLEDNRLARDAVNAASVCAGVAGAITIGNRAPGVSPAAALLRGFAWPTCRNSGGAALAASIATDPPEGLGVLGRAVLDTCADDTPVIDLLEQLVCSGSPPGRTPPAAGSSPAAVPGAPGARQLATVPAVVPVDGVDPPAASPAFRSPAPAATPEQPTAYAPLPDGRRGRVVHRQDLSGTGPSDHVRGSLVTVEDPETGERYVSVQPTVVEYDNNTRLLFLPQVPGRIVGENLQGRTARVVALPEGQDVGRVTPATPIDRIRIRTGPGETLEFNGGGDPMRSVPGFAMIGQAGDVRKELWTVFPASHMNWESGEEQRSARVPVGSEGIDLFQPGPIEIVAQAGSRGVTVVQKRQAFTPTPPVPTRSVSPAATPAPVAAAPVPARPSRSPAPVAPRPGPVQGPNLPVQGPVYQPQPEPGLLQRGVDAVTGLYGRLDAAGRESLRTTIRSSEPLDGTLGFGVKRHRVWFMDDGRGIYDPEGNLLETERGNPPLKVPGWMLFKPGGNLGVPGPARPGGSVVPRMSPVFVR